MDIYLYISITCIVFKPECDPIRNLWNCTAKQLVPVYFVIRPFDGYIFYMKSRKIFVRIYSNYLYRISVPASEIYSNPLVGSVTSLPSSSVWIVVYRILRLMVSLVGARTSLSIRSSVATPEWTGRIGTRTTGTAANTRAGTTTGRIR